MKLKKIYINDEAVNLENLTIIVGSNGVGKTTFLRDLRYTFINTKPNGTIYSLNNIKWSNLCRGDSFSVSLSEWKIWLNSIKVTTGENADNQRLYALPQSLGRQQKPQKMRENDRNDAIIYSNSSEATVDGLENSWTHIFRDQYTAFLSVDDRFYVSNNSSGQLSPDAMNNLQPAPFLAINKDILKRINQAISKLFNKKLSVESSLFPTYNILVTKTESTAMRRLATTPQGHLGQRMVYDQWVVNNSAAILSDDGHGIRAAIEILYALETPTNNIIFIDEPELHLYPASKYQLGRIIGDYASSSKKQIILSTHDSDFLRGLLHGTRKSTIIRLNKDRSINTVVGRSIKNTASNEILQSSFLDAVILTEGIGDQFVYRSVFQQKHLLKKFSYQFISSGGKESIADDFNFYKSLGIAFAVILDYDSLFSTKRNGLVKHCLTMLGVPSIDISDISILADDVNTFSKGMQYKKRGLNNVELSYDQKIIINKLLTKLKGYGLFIVPQGELEDWVGVSKPISPEDIYSRYRSSSNKKYKNLTDFSAEIEKYILKELL